MDQALRGRLFSAFLPSAGASAPTPRAGPYDHFQPARLEGKSREACFSRIRPAPAEENASCRSILPRHGQPAGKAKPCRAPDAGRKAGRYMIRIRRRHGLLIRCRRRISRRLPHSFFPQRGATSREWSARDVEERRRLRPAGERPAARRRNKGVPRCSCRNRGRAAKGGLRPRPP